MNLTITLGDMVIALTILTAVIAFGRRVWEHDMMWVDYAERKGLKPNSPKRDFK